MTLPVDATLYLAFCLATAALVLLPGPMVTLIVTNALARGTRFGLATTAGSAIGTSTFLVIGAFGLAPLLALIAPWYDVLGWLGAAYLVYLGVKQFRAAPAASQAPRAGDLRAVFWQGVWVAMLNPKSLLFYVAFFPQFITPDLPIGPQLAVLSASFLIIALAIDSLYAVLAGRLNRVFSNQRWARLRNRVLGTVLMATGAGLAASQRS